MNLGFDIDGVISNFTERFKEVVQQHYGISLTENNMYCYDVDLVLGIPKEDVANIVDETLRSNLPLVPLAKETLDKLHSEGHRIYLLTARSNALISSTSTWLKEKGIPYDEIYFLAMGKKRLADVHVDLVVEDSLEEALELTKKVKNVLLFDQTWNRTVNVKGLLKRVYSWPQIYEEIQKLSATSSKKPSSI
jgi:hypothetical protein